MVDYFSLERARIRANNAMESILTRNSKSDPPMLLMAAEGSATNWTWNPEVAEQEGIESIERSH